MSLRTGSVMVRRRRHKLVWRALCALALPIAGLACGVFDPVICTLEARPSVTLSVVDSLTADPVSADSVTVWAVSGSFADSLRVSSDVAARVLGFGEERPGTYDVGVDAAGYRPWRVNGLVVTADECHVRTVALTARLVPE